MPERTITAATYPEMTTTELHALLLTVRLTTAEMRAIRAELRSREI